MAETPRRGWCDTCRAEVVIDGRPGNAEETIWSHLREEAFEVVVPGHDPSCQGDCRNCPVPVPDVEYQVVECGSVHPLEVQA